MGSPPAYLKQEVEMKFLATAVIALGAMGLPLQASEGQAATEAKAPVAIARTGFTPSQAREFRERYSPEEVISAGDVSLFHFLNLGIWLPTVMVSRQGEVVDLARTRGEARILIPVVLHPLHGLAEALLPGKLFAHLIDRALQLLDIGGIQHVDRDRQQADPDHPGDAELGQWHRPDVPYRI
mgnify:CR=1 FL=1